MGQTHRRTGTGKVQIIFPRHFWWFIRLIAAAIAVITSSSTDLLFNWNVSGSFVYIFCWCWRWASKKMKIIITNYFFLKWKSNIYAKNLPLQQAKCPPSRGTRTRTRLNANHTILIDFSTRMISITGLYLFRSYLRQMNMYPPTEYNNKCHAVAPPVMPRSPRGPDPCQLVAPEINCDSRFTGESTNKKSLV